jgi:uncharacterized CHY-type Zn-finger protein
VNTPAKLIEMPTTSKVLLCGKCKRAMVVSLRTVMVFCPDCSENLGVKQ